MPTTSGVDSSKFKIFLSSDGTAAGTPQELEAQGDLTINPGKGTDRVVAKNATLSWQTNEGFSVEGAFYEERPLGTAQTLLWAANDDNERVYAWIEDEEEGGLSFEGFFRVGIGSIASGSEGVNTHSFTLSADGPTTRGTVPAAP